MDTKVGYSSKESKNRFIEKVDEKLFHEVDLGIKRNTRQIYIDSIVYMYMHGVINIDEIKQFKFS